MSGRELIEAERVRQRDVEGWSEDHDRTHLFGELRKAGACYMDAQGPADEQPEGWPWDETWWKPKDRLRNLVRAGALFLAEKARLERQLERVPHMGMAMRRRKLREVEECEALANAAAQAIDALGAVTEPKQPEGATFPFDDSREAIYTRQEGE